MIEIIPNWHPVFVHFPVVLTTAAVAFTAAGAFSGTRPHAVQCVVTGRWMLWSAALFALIAAAFGWFAFNSVEHDEVSHAAMTLHRNWALGTLVVLVVLAAWDVWRGGSRKTSSLGFLGLLVTVWMLVASTAWHGAELVYRHGLGVMSLPDVHAVQDMMAHDEVGHAHDHAH